MNCMTDSPTTDSTNDHTSTHRTAQPVRRFERDPNGMLGGVASGLAHYFDIDVALTRLLLVFATLTAGVGPLLYLAAWVLVPVAAAPLTPPYGQPMPGPASGSYVV